MFDELFSRLRHAPAAQGLLRRVESGGALTCGGVTGSGYAFLAAWLHREFPQRPIVLVAENLKAQEVLHQDLETWLRENGQRPVVSGQKEKASFFPPHLRSPNSDLRTPISHLRFFPAWEILPHEDKLPHADVISERLETLVELMRSAECGVRNEGRAHAATDSAFRIPHSALVTTSITALLQRTFPPALLAARTRTLRRGDRVDPLDLIEWLEDNGYDSEAQVSAKGEIALRGGIVDVFPLTSPWPVRLEFFGDELESLRTFDPVTQVSREGGEMSEIVLPPAGELGVLKRGTRNAERGTGGAPSAPLATLLDYLPDETIVILGDPEAIERHAEEYGELVPTNDPFFASWEELRGELLRRKLTVVALLEDSCSLPMGGGAMAEVIGQENYGQEDSNPNFSAPNFPAKVLSGPLRATHGLAGRASSDDPLATDTHPLSPALSPNGGEEEESALSIPERADPIDADSSLITNHFSLQLSSLEAFRPISDRMPEQEIALAQRQAFFHQLASWLRQGFHVQVVCNNDGEAQRFQEVWREMGLESPVERLGEAIEPISTQPGASNLHTNTSNVRHQLSNRHTHTPNVTLLGLNAPPHTPNAPAHTPDAPTHEPNQGTHSPDAPPYAPNLDTRALNVLGHEADPSAHAPNPVVHAPNVPAQGTNASSQAPNALAHATQALSQRVDDRKLRSRKMGHAPKDHSPFPILQFPVVSLGTLARGFLCEAAKFVVVTDAEVFGRYKVQRPRRMKSAHAIAARSSMDIDFAELEEGDYVVHLQHGIGRFKGLKVLPTNKPGRERHHLDAEALRPAGDASAPGSSRREEAPSSSPKSNQSLLTSAATRVEEGIECLVLEYAPSDTDREPPKLYVPVTEAHLISKYVGAGKMRPPLNTLGGKRWEKTKQQAERAVRDVAADLLAIQAKRATQPGHAFGPDTPWQREFESSFLYEETPDQLRAIAEAKHDLEIAKPMDRLVCGDVGFGKTEVAIRAAFKAVMGGKQVALLVPTTVLAQQHYNTFRERMADYPVRVELLSRFRTRKEQLKVVEQLAAGAVDIVIGTHRLVQSDVTFKELGLVIIDEEQRFGVMHKEKFKLMRTHVDVLTLSATPIPRTLYLALTGARDMSTIQTPPQDRLPVETIVEHYDDRVIRDAILRELGRGGQVFFLHNRVTTIEAMRSKLQLLVPHARVVVGHGQMSGDELEDVMTKFVNGEADVLLSTTIIESGLDIPNANTLIIDRADRFGLSQLYQLRGRVGRYKHQAFAYLLLPRHARLLTDVRKRMSAIKQYAQLGSGFKIAMRDLEIRGAGNLLGAQQSGHITAVGFELYCNLLKQSVAALKGEKVKQRTNATLRLDFLAMNPVAEGEAEDRKEKREDRLTRQEQSSRPQTSISVPREGGVWVQKGRREREEEVVEVKKGGAFLPPAYISEPQHRIEAYRKLAQAESKADVDALQRELKDRYGTPPKPVELLLLATELKLLAGERGLDAIETKAGKLMLHRRGDYIQLGGKFPRLTKTEPLAVLKEIKKLLLSL